MEQEHIEHNKVPDTNSANKTLNMPTIPLLFEPIPARFGIVRPNTILNKDTQTISNAPPEPFPLQVMPQPYVHKYEPRTQPLVLPATERDVQVADSPLVEARMPELPEETRAQHHGDTVRHVLMRVYAVEYAEQTEEAPDDEELHPHPVHNVDEHGEELERAHPGGPHPDLVDGVCIEVMVGDVKGYDVEPDLSQFQKGLLYGQSLLRSVILRDERVEGHYWTGNVKDGVENVNEKVNKVVIFNRSVFLL